MRKITERGFFKTPYADFCHIHPGLLPRNSATAVERGGPRYLLEPESADELQAMCLHCAVLEAVFHALFNLGYKTETFSTPTYEYHNLTLEGLFLHPPGVRLAEPTWPNMYPVYEGKLQKSGYRDALVQWLRVVERFATIAKATEISEAAITQVLEVRKERNYLLLDQRDGARAYLRALWDVARITKLLNKEMRL